jgi:SlyX protein
MSEEDRVESRLTELEVKLSFSENLLDELNRALYRQQQHIDRLEQALRGLRQQVQDNTPAEARSLRDELPPHY